MQDKRVFLALFIIAGFVMKIVAEFVHEICGHGSFLLLFGGEVTSIYISLLWPHELSYISWSLPSTITSAQRAWIYGGGIFVSLCLSFSTQALLSVEKRITRYYAVALFWLAFWTFISSTGYLIIGGLTPFGDVYELVNLGVLTIWFSLILGLIIFVAGFIALSWGLRGILAEVLSFENASLGVPFFWLILPVLGIAMLANPELSFQVAYLPLTFVPALLSFIIEYFLILPRVRTWA